MSYDIDFFSFLSIFIPTLVGLFCYSQILTTTKILVLYALATALLEIGVASYYYLEWNNLWLFHIHTYLEFAVFSIIYTRLTRFEWLKRIILALIPVFILFSFFNSLFWENVTGFNSIQRHVEGSLIILYALAFMLETRKYFGNPWHESPYLIFSFGVLIYFSGSLFLFIFGRKMFSTGDDAYWALHGYLNIFLNLVFTAVILRSNAMPPKVK